jgi:hypothetical protein
MYADHMAEPARHRVPDGEAVPEAITHEEKTVEMPAVPEHVGAEETVPVRSSLEKILRHEMLRHQSSQDDAG